jgi:hypothetical protein
MRISIIIQINVGHPPLEHVADVACMPASKFFQEGLINVVVRLIEM